MGVQQLAVEGALHSCLSVASSRDIQRYSRRSTMEQRCPTCARGGGESCEKPPCNRVQRNETNASAHVFAPNIINIIIPAGPTPLSTFNRRRRSQQTYLLHHPARHVNSTHERLKRYVDLSRCVHVIVSDGERFVSVSKSTAGFQILDVLPAAVVVDVRPRTPPTEYFGCTCALRW